MRMRQVADNVASNRNLFRKNIQVERRPHLIDSPSSSSLSLIVGKWSQKKKTFRNCFTHRSLLTVLILLLSPLIIYIITTKIEIVAMNIHSPLLRPQRQQYTRHEAPIHDTKMYEGYERRDVDQNESLTSNQKTAVYDTPLLVFSCHRHQYLNRTLRAIYKYHPMITHTITSSPFQDNNQIIVAVPIIVSQDGYDPLVTAVIQTYSHLFRSVGVPFYHMIHDDDDSSSNDYILKDFDKALTLHYAWALENVFSRKVFTMHAAHTTRHLTTSGRTGPMATNITYPFYQQPPSPKRVIILEEDIEIASDFFSYMAATAPLLDTDKTLFAISAYNDNGKKSLVGDPHRLLRSDFFPGLGWMMHNSLWNEIQPPHWPVIYWDDWLRNPKQRKGRQVIRPEVSRTFHFGLMGGTTSNQYSHHLRSVYLNTENIDWGLENLTYLETNVFQKTYRSEVAQARTVAVHTTPNDMSSATRDITRLLVAKALEESKNGSVKIEYEDWDTFTRLANVLELMDNQKAGVPRTAYEGIVECRPHGKGGHLLYLVPKKKSLIIGRVDWIFGIVLAVFFFLVLRRYRAW